MESSNESVAYLEYCAKTTQNDSGLINLENKCLSEKLQAVRRAVLGLSSSAEWIASDKHFDVQLPFIQCSMADLFEFIKSIRKEFPTGFTTSSPRSSEVYNNSLQIQRDSSSQSQDAWVYMQFLLKTLIQPYMTAEDRVDDRKIWSAFYSSSWNCLSCLHKSDFKNQEFQDFEFSLTETYTINDALTRHFAREPFYRTCEKCKQHAEVQQSFFLTQEPFVLCIRGKIYGTINIQTQFSPEIDLSQHFYNNEDYCMLKYRLVSMVLQSKDDHHIAILRAKDGSYTEYSYFNERVISNYDVTNAKTYLALYELKNSTPIGISSSEVSTDFNSGSEIYSNDERSLDTSSSGLGTSESSHSITIESDEIMQPTPVTINVPNTNTNSGDDSNGESINSSTTTRANESIYDSRSACSTSSQTSPFKNDMISTAIVSSKIESDHKKTLRTRTGIHKTKYRETLKEKLKKVKYESNLSSSVLVQQKSATIAYQNQNHTAVGSRKTRSTKDAGNIEMDTTAVGSTKSAATKDDLNIKMDTNDPNDGKMYEIFSLESGAEKAKTEQILQNYGSFIKELSIHPLKYYSYTIDLVDKYCSGTLESLSLYNCKIPKTRTEQFLFTNLRKLYIKNVNNGQIGFLMENLFSSNLEHFECEDDNHEEYNFEKFIRYHPNLKTIIIRKSTHLVNLLPAMAEFCKQLEELEIKVTDNSGAAREALKSLRTLSHLKKLTFNCTKNKNVATFIELLNSFESLKTLELLGADGNREFVKSVSKLKNVRTLELFLCCDLSDLNPLAQLSQLTELTIANNYINDIQLDTINLLNSLHNLKTLKLYINDFEIDETTISMMRNINVARPALKIYGDCR